MALWGLESSLCRTTAAAAAAQKMVGPCHYEMI